MAKKREKHSGQLLRGLFMVFSHLKQPTFSMTRTVTGSFQRLLSKLRDVPRLQGKPLTSLLVFDSVASSLCVTKDWTILRCNSIGTFEFVL